MGPTSPSARLLILHLLRHPDEPASARAIAERLGFSAPAVNDVMRFLEFHGALDSLPTRRVRWRRLAGLAGSLRLPDLVPARAVPGTPALHMVHAALDDAGIAHVFGFTTAANQWAYFEPDPDLHVIIPSESVAAASHAIRHAADGTSRGRVNLFSDRLSALETERLGELTLTSRLQTWIDLQHFPHAGAHAAFFEHAIADLMPREAAP